MQPLFSVTALLISVRTHDQMVQAARSGVQNIAEAVLQQRHQKIEIKLTNVAHASPGELLLDYEDFTPTQTSSVEKGRPGIDQGEV